MTFDINKTTLIEM